MVSSEWANHYIFWAGPAIGAIIATLAFELFFRSNFYLDPVSKPVISATTRP